ncbi:hypothetical protein NPX13_g3008 [Xylaria arbuscula]|uniref:RRM domain-containing protein n=1 Tax=Xylaria arbuscula TaxID=114810 RepID=A0A9W8NIQ0_9PEZI|nr:hypothetical protein NPX13_g3008 [Xylaria arbuscula]
MKEPPAEERTRNHNNPRPNNLDLAGRQQREDTLNALNSRVYLYNLPRDTPYEQLFLHLRGRGRVRGAGFYISDRYPPAIVEFFTHADAASLLKNARERRFFVGRWEIHAEWSDIICREAPDDVRTRVVVFRGNVSVVNRDNFQRIWNNSGEEIEIERIVSEFAGLSKKNTLYYYFTSLKIALHAWAAVYMEYGNSVEIAFGPDPCGP